VEKLPRIALDYIRKHELLRAGDRVGIAVSGGADSVALLRLFLDLRKEVGLVLSVVHFNHKLRGAESNADQRFISELAQRHELELYCESGEVAARAAENHLSVETAAREMRYQYFRQLLLEDRLNRVATGHTLDDQAETVLLKIVRGAGSRGLAGIYPHLKVTRNRPSVFGSQERQNAEGSIIRPLLATRRRDLEAYLRALGQTWREDKSNRDLRHMRNRMRHGILPRLERYFNPSVREAVGETAEIARAEEEYWEKEVARVLPQVWQAAEPESAAGPAQGMLDVSILVNLPLATQRRVIRAASESLGMHVDFEHVDAILALCSKRYGSVVLPDEWLASRKKTKLWFEPGGRKPTVSHYEYRLCVPGSVEVRETDSRFEAVLVSGNAFQGYNPEHLLDPELLAAELRVRNWRPGDRFWPSHTKVAKKIKELLEERHVTGPARKLWPVVVSGQEVVWVRGFRAPAQFRPGNVRDRAVLLLRETALADRADLGNNKADWPHE
jgi:tRNA(Ile)-lysidine synthase